MDGMPIAAGRRERANRPHRGLPHVPETVDANTPQRQGMLMPWRKGIYRHTAMQTAIAAGTAETGPDQALAWNRARLQTRRHAVDDSAIHLHCRAVPRKP